MYKQYNHFALYEVKTLRKRDSGKATLLSVGLGPITPPPATGSAQESQTRRPW